MNCTVSENGYMDSSYFGCSGVFKNDDRIHSKALVESLTGFDLFSISENERNSFEYRPMSTNVALRPSVHVNGARCRGGSVLHPACQ